MLREEFPGYENSPYEVVLVDAGSAEEVRAYAEQVSQLEGIERVTTPTDVIVDGQVVAPNADPATWTSGSDVRMAAVGSVPPIDPAGEQLLADIRGIPAPASEVLVGGVAADWADATQSILDRFWWVIVWLALTTLVILFLYTGSLLIPVKAFVLNLLSLSAALGLLVWVFQDGRLSWLTGDYTVTGTVDMSTLVLVGVIAFALHQREGATTELVEDRGEQLGESDRRYIRGRVALAVTRPVERVHGPRARERWNDLCEIPMVTSIGVQEDQTGPLTPDVDRQPLDLSDLVRHAGRIHDSRVIY